MKKLHWTDSEFDRTYFFYFFVRYVGVWCVLSGLSWMMFRLYDITFCSNSAGVGPCLLPVVLRRKPRSTTAIFLCRQLIFLPFGVNKCKCDLPADVICVNAARTRTSPLAEFDYSQVTLNSTFGFPAQH